jgi:hypothetical protein
MDKSFPLVMVAVMVVVTFTLGQLKNDSVERDVPLPAPFSRFEILDVGKAGAPIKAYGTAYAYIKRFPSGNIMTWNEDTDLRVQNVSSKIITAMDLETQSVSFDGTDMEHTRHLIPLKNPLNPGESWNQPLNHVPGMRPKVGVEEFNKLTKMTPEVTAHVTSVTFSDGTAYKEGPSEAAPRVPLKDQNVLPNTN